MEPSADFTKSICETWSRSWFPACYLDFQNEDFGLYVSVLLSYPDMGTNFINVFLMLRIIVAC